MKKSILILVIGILFFTGCADKTPNINFNSAVNKDIKEITIIQPNKVEEFTIFYYNHPANNFGLIGAVVAASEFKTKTTTYNELVKSNKLDVNSYLIGQLKRGLLAQGYKVSILDNKERKKEHLKEYPKVKTDSFLDIVLSDVGYVSGGTTSVYKPTVKLAIRMVRNSDKSVVYNKHIAIGESFALNENVDYLGFKEGFTYSKFDELKENAIKSIEGIKESIDAVVAHLVKSLKK